MSLRPLTEAEKMDIEVGRMMRKVAGDPKTRRELYQTLKKADPNIRWPDQDIEDFKAQYVADKEREQIEAEAKKSRALMEVARIGMVKKYGADNVKKIEKLMEQHGLHDYALGAKLWNAEQPPPEPAGSYPESNRWTMPSDKELLENPSAWANKMAHQTISEFKRNRGVPGR